MASQHGRGKKAWRRLYVPQIAQITPRVHVPDALCTTGQTFTLPRVRMAVRRPDCGDNHMLFFVGVVTALIAVVIIPRMRVPGGVNSASLGWMSERWLAEHRALHSE